MSLSRIELLQREVEQDTQAMVALYNEKRQSFYLNAPAADKLKYEEKNLPIYQEMLGILMCQHLTYLQAIEKAKQEMMSASWQVADESIQWSVLIDKYETIIRAIKHRIGQGLDRYCVNQDLGEAV